MAKGKGNSTDRRLHAVIIRFGNGTRSVYGVYDEHEARHTAEALREYSGYDCTVTEWDGSW